MVGAMAVALRRHENKGIKDSVSTMAVKREEQTMRKYHSIDRSIETIGLRTRSGLRAGLPYSNTPPQAARSPSSTAKCLTFGEGNALVNVSAIISAVGQ